MSSFAEEQAAANEAHRKANEEAAPNVKAGWLTDLVGGSLGSVMALCPICASYVPNTNVAKVMHQNWHAAAETAEDMRLDEIRRRQEMRSWDDDAS